MNKKGWCEVDDDRFAYEVSKAVFAIVRDYQDSRLGKSEAMYDLLTAAASFRDNSKFSDFQKKIGGEVSEPESLQRLIDLCNKNKPNQ